MKEPQVGELGSTGLPGPDEKAVRDAAGNLYIIAAMMYNDQSTRLKLAF